MRRPTIRFAYWIGIRRCPSCTKTTATITPIAISGNMIFSTGPPFHQAWIPVGSAVRIEAKISSEMPLPMPRFVICSPNHIRSVAPAVSVSTIRITRAVDASSAPCRLNRYV